MTAGRTNCLVIGADAAHSSAAYAAAVADALSTGAITAATHRPDLGRDFPGMP